MMKISKIGEFGLIERIKKVFNNPDIGSDCAPIKIGRDIYLATCDILLEDEHFLRRYPPEMVGFKAIAVNVSDIVASGGKPISVLVSLMLPDVNVDYVDRINKGIKKACDLFRCQVIGGNVTSSEKIGIDIFMLGKAKKFVPRRSAGIGDYVYVTGALGDSKAGLELLLKNKKSLEPYEAVLVERHLKPDIEIKTSDIISRNATSSMDLSDGLSSDIYKLFDENKFKIVLDSSKIPYSAELKTYSEKYRRNALHYALAGGEDYKIMFTSRTKIPGFFEIGKVRKGRGIYVDNKKLPDKSFDHFRS